MTSISEGGARDGRYQTAVSTGRLVTAYIINDLTTGDDPKRNFSVWQKKLVGCMVNRYVKYLTYSNNRVIYLSSV